MNKKLYIKYGPKTGSKCIDTIENFSYVVSDLLKDADDDELWEFHKLQMTEEEFKQLPEFSGF